MNTRAILYLFVMGAAPLAAQSFEVASITPRDSAVGPFHFRFLPNRLDALNLSLGYLIEQAFDVPEFQLTGPDVVLRPRFDILATSGPSASHAEMRVMLRNLLAERFHLRTHWETRSEASYRMAVLPGGPKMKTSEVGYAGANSPMRDGSSLQLNGPMSMRQLAEQLNELLRKPVVDTTNLDGYFTIELTFASDDFDATKDVSRALAPLPKALEEQLGLKLIPGKEPIRYLVVDHADVVPTHN